MITLFHVDDRSAIMNIINGSSKLNKIIKTMLHLTVQCENRFGRFFCQNPTVSNIRELS